MTDNLKLYRFEYDCGRMGELDGLFVASDKDLLEIEGKYINFGEVLGKHSDISIRSFSASEYLVEVSNDSVFIDKLVDVLGSYHVSGYNPLHYYDYEDED